MRIEILAESVANAHGVFSRGDVMTASEADCRPLVESGAAKWIEGPPGEPALQVDETLWALNADQAIALIRKQTDGAVIRRWHTGEARNPRFPPEGRKTVRDALEERLGELGVEAPSLPEEW